MFADFSHPVVHCLDNHMDESITSLTQATTRKDQLANRPVCSSALVVGQWMNIENSSNDNKYLNTSPVPSTKCKRKPSGQPKKPIKSVPTVTTGEVSIKTAAGAPARKK